MIGILEDKREGKTLGIHTCDNGRALKAGQSQLLWKEVESSKGKFRRFLKGIIEMIYKLLIIKFLDLLRQFRGTAPHNR
jgi:hypothetical protein